MIDDLFVLMSAEFGHRFTSNYPTEKAEQAAKSVWCKRLDGLTASEIHLGIDRLQEYSEISFGWPPGAVEFRALCRPHREPYERPEFQGQALPQKPASQEFAQKHIDEIHKKLKTGATRQ